RERIMKLSRVQRRRACRNAGLKRRRFAPQLESLEPRRLLATLFEVDDSELSQGNNSTSLIAWDADWRYLDNGSDQGTTWRATGFDDSSWQLQPAELGYGDGGEATLVGFGGDPNNKFITTYFRKTVNIADPSSVSTLDLSVIRDDGIAVFLNGVELLRDNLVANAAFSDLATTAIGGAGETTAVVTSILTSTLPPGTLVAGNNVISAEIHQANATSSDISFNLELTGSSSPLQIRIDFSQAVDANTLQPGDLVIDGSGSATQVTLTDADTAVFDLPDLTPGSHTLSIAGGAVLDVVAEPLLGFNRVVTIASDLQYRVNHTPRLQPGDAPLDPFPGSQTDRVDILWQTENVGSGTEDSFVVDYRLDDPVEAWTAVAAPSQVSVGVGTRFVHTATVSSLTYDTMYEYRVRHYRGDVLVDTHQSNFRTRLAVGDSSSFSFVAYGDSADPANIQRFRDVQSRINQVDPAFAVLLGDNVYESGSHIESDSRFDATINPEAAAWTAGKIDYVGYGNHDEVTGGGDPTELNFSAPIPVAGITSSVQPPVSEMPERNYSFDYGDVHFVTFNTNSLGDATRLDALLTWVELDLAASNATWKVVYGHHPVAGVPDKPESPSGNYYQQVVSRLRAANVDLFLTGHSHTYGWTYPLVGEQGGQATFVNDTDKDYAKGAGLVQVVAGTGGRSLRSGTFTQFPFIASGFSTSTSPVSEYGFAQIDVTPTQLTVNYVAADDGAVLDSFSISAGPPTAQLIGPLDGGPDDLDPVSQQVIVNTTQAAFDIQLQDGEEGVDDSTVTSGTVSVLRDQVQLTESVDYTFSYDAISDVISLTSLGGPFGNYDYEITLNGGANKIADQAGNQSPPTTFDVTIDTSIPVEQSVEFQEGTAGYTNTVDTFVQQASPDVNNALSGLLNVDSDDPAGSGQDVQALLRFDSIFGSAAGQIPAGSLITSASLAVEVTNVGDSLDVHRMLQPWSDSDTWNSLVGGVANDDIEANSVPDVSSGSVGAGTFTIDVTSSLANWSSDPNGNLGWVMRPTNTNGVDFHSSEGTTPPKLTVTFIPPASGPVPVAVADNYSVDEDSGTTTLAPAVTGNDDFGGDGPSTGAISIVNAASNGTAVINDNSTPLDPSDDTVDYTPDANFSGTDQFSYRITDGNGDNSTANVNITVTAVNDAPVAVAQSVSTAEDSALAIVLTGSDIDGDSLTFSIATGPTN
ncbi:MAG: hypothetical protein ACI9HK_005856, partial [Pirellulaceae bacterium]